MTVLASTTELPRLRQARAVTLARAWWVPLAVILAAQAALSARLMHLGYASGDEARYIYAGHQLIHEFWHGGGSPYFETYFSGAPVLYCPIAAVVDHFGGLIAVRLMSTMLMLGATSILYATTRRLFGYWPAVAAAGLFAGLGLTQVLGAYADYDSLALTLMAAAAYCAVRTREDEPRSARWLIVLPAVILAANIAKYVTVAFDPVVISIAALQLQPLGWQRVLRRLAALSAATGALLLGALYLAGTAYLSGILFTTLNRPSGTQVVFQGVSESTRSIVSVTWSWIGLALVLSATAVVIAVAVRRDRQHVLLLLVLTIAGILVTAEGIHLHTTESMKRHDDFSAWFTCVAAGYALARLIDALKGWAARVAAILAAAAVVVLSGMHYSPSAPGLYPAHTVQSQVQAFGVLKPYLALHDGRFLLGGLTDDLMLYTEHLGVPWYQHFDDVYIKYPIPGRGGDSHGEIRGRACMKLRAGCMYLEGDAGYQAAIRAHWFAVISMIGAHNGVLPQDKAIEKAVASTPGYVLLTRAGGAPTWIYAPAFRSAAR